MGVLKRLGLFADLQCPECQGGYCIEIKESPSKQVLESDLNVRTVVPEADTTADESVPGTSGLGATLNQSGSKNSIGKFDFFLEFERSVAN